MSPSRRRWFKGVAALLSVVFGMGILELCLRMAGVGYPTTFFVKTRHEGEDYWMENPGFLYRFMPKAQARSPRPIMVPVAKKDHTIRIFVLGESAAMGDPEPAFGMPEILRVLLESRYPQTRFEVVNTALTAINSHLIHHIAAECVQKEADFLVLYMGNNEVTGPMGPGTVFGDTRSDSWMLQLGLQLKKYHLGQAMDALRERLSRNLGGESPKGWGGIAMFEGRHVAMDDPRLTRVHASFEHHLEAILNSAQKQGVAVVLSSLACNLKDSAPFASSSLNHLEESRRQSWQDAYDQGIALLEASLAADALGAFQTAESIDANHADLQFSLGTSLLALGETAEAQPYFKHARDLDLLRFRPSDELNDIIKRSFDENQSQGVYFFDLEKSMEAMSEGGLPGDVFFWDHVHFKFQGNYLLARGFAEQIAAGLDESGRLSSLNTSEADWLGAETCASKLGLTRWGQYQMVEAMLNRLNQFPFSRQSNRPVLNTKMLKELEFLKLDVTPEVLKSMMDIYARAIEGAPHNWMVLDQYARFLKDSGEPMQAVDHWKKILEIVPHHVMARFELGRLLSRDPEKVAEAETYLREAIDLRPYIPEIHMELGLCLGRQNKAEEALSAFSRAVEIQPNAIQAHINWASALRLLGRNQEAIERLEQALTISTNSVAAHLKMARFQTPGKNWEKVIFHLQEVLRLDPDHKEATDALSKVQTLLLQESN